MESLQNMKRLESFLMLCVVSLVAMAVPAKPGIWKTLTLKDGTEVRAQLKGDEFTHYWMTAEGHQFVKEGDVYVEVDKAALARRGMKRRVAAQTSIKTRRVSPGSHTHYIGTKKGLVILVNYQDVKFKSTNNKGKYEKILNTEGYTTSEGFKGSVADYFKAQSNGQFGVEFDVYGPVTLAHEQKYYGENNEDGEDMRPEDMVVEACRAINSQVNFHDYDWDGDGEVDVVYVVYAGKGEASGGSDNTVWPHMYELELCNINLFLDNVQINTYACSNEIDYYSKIEGIGGICHEFSHCLGYADLYDVVNGSMVTLEEYDIMDAGLYNGNGFVPAGYSAYEKWMAGWIELTKLSDKDVIVKGLEPVSEGGGGYIIYNDGHPDEYYIIENRQQTNWDAHIPGKGLMITHVDYDEQLWYLNVPNSILNNTSYYVTAYGYPTNDHSRLNIFRADDKEKSSTSSLANDLYPYLGNDSLTATSKPAATFYNMNKQGDKLMHGGILDITQNSKGTMSFVYRSPTTDTGIHEVLSAGDKIPSVVYDLQGRRVSEGALRKGIYLINGKKVLQ